MGGISSVLQVNIGDIIGSATPNAVLFSSAAGALSDSANFTYDGFTIGAVGDDGHAKYVNDAITTYADAFGTKAIGQLISVLKYNATVDNFIEGIRLTVGLDPTAAILGSILQDARGIHILGSARAGNSVQQGYGIYIDDLSEGVAGTFTAQTGLYVGTLAGGQNKAIVTNTARCEFNGEVYANMTAGDARFDSAGIAVSGANRQNAIAVNAAAMLGRFLRVDGTNNTPGASVGTLNNAPAAGDPTWWLEINLNGANYKIPCWPG